MGVVYKARDTPPQTVRLPSGACHRKRSLTPSAHRRFVQEARSASALNHPNIVAVYDIDRTEGIDFIAMEPRSGDPG